MNIDRWIDIAKGIDIMFIFAGVVYWSECRFEEGGRYVVCSSKVNEEGFTAWTPEGFNARTRIHEYGGGSFFVYDGAVYFSNFQDQRLYIQKSATETPVALTPADCGWRYADMQFCAQVRLMFDNQIHWSRCAYSENDILIH